MTPRRMAPNENSFRVTAVIGNVFISPLNGIAAVVHSPRILGAGRQAIANRDENCWQTGDGGRHKSQGILVAQHPVSSMDKQEYWELTGWSPIRQVQVNFLPVFGSVFHIELDLCLLPYFFGALQRNCQVFSSGHRVLWGGSVGFRHRLILVKCCPGIVSDGQISAITVKVRLSPLRKRICLWLHHQTR